jgi:GTP-binding protein
VKIAPYPFTTLRPNLGIVHFDNECRILIADIPGIIENAHENRGLGFAFLRHIERTSVLVFVIELAPWQNRNPIEELLMLRKELEAYNPEMLKKPFAVALNKIDAEGAREIADKFIAEYPFDPATLFEISAREDIGLEPLKQRLRELVYPEPLEPVLTEATESNEIFEEYITN